MSWYDDDYPLTPEELFAITRARIAAIERKAVLKLIARRQYETINPAESLDEKIKRLCVLVISKGRFAVGLEYRSGESAAPILIIKTSDVKWITRLGRKNGISIVYNKKAAEYIFYHTKEYSAVPSDIWQDVAKIFKKLIEKDQAFVEKINYTG